tara:strand:- start:14212 stop:14343 length:132 start_codon:yes stop_codon:yes gene_type:complete
MGQALFFATFLSSFPFQVQARVLSVCALAGITGRQTFEFSTVD